MYQMNRKYIHFVSSSGSPAPAAAHSPGGYRSALQTPVASLPHTVFPPENPWGPAPAPQQANSPAPPAQFGSYSPALVSPLGYREEFPDEGEPIGNQVRLQ